jgi:hypothetical protein
MDVPTISQEIYGVAKRLENAISSLFQYATYKATTERDYRMALSKTILILKTEGTSISLIGDLAKGAVADKMFERDLAEAKYKANIESISALQSQLSALQSLLRYHE